MKKKALSLLVFLSFLFIASQSWAKPLDYCLQIFNESQTPVSLNELPQESQSIGDRIEARYTPTGPTVELPEIKPTDQCYISECSLFSFVNYLNVIGAQNSDASSSFRISHSLLVAQKFLQHIRDGVWYGTSNDRVVHNLYGGLSYKAIDLSRKVGLAPEESWQPKVPFENWDTKRIYDVLETKVPQWHKYVKGLAFKHGNWNAAPVRDAYKQAFDELKMEIINFTGELPESFEFKGTTMTTTEFELKYGAPRRVRLFIELRSGIKLPKRTDEVLNSAMIANGNGGWVYGRESVNSMLNGAVRWLDVGQPVIADFAWQGRTAHSMLIVGYELNPQNRVKRFKVMNSWGEEFGNDGYAWYTVEDITQRIIQTHKFGKL